MKPRRVALALWFAGLLLALWQVAHTPFRADLSAFLPAHPQASQQLLLDQLQSGLAARTLLIGLEGGDTAGRADASKRLAAALRQSGRFEQVANGERDAWRDTGEWLRDHRYLLSPAVTPAHFETDGLRAALDDTLALLGTPAGALVKPLLERDPTGELVRIAESLTPPRAPRVEAGVWMSRAAPRAVLLASTRAAGADLDAQAAAIDAVRRAFDALQSPGLQLQLGGAPSFAVDSRARIEHAAIGLASVGVVLMAALLGLAFGTVRAIGLAMLPVATGALAGVAAVGLVFGSVHGLTLAFGSTLIGESVDYAIYYLIQSRGGWQAWRVASWPTVRLGLWTSVCGFAALVFSGFPGLAQLGVFSIAGLAAAALCTRFVLPVVAPDGAAGRGLRHAMGRLTERALARLPRFRIALLLLGALATLLVLARGGSAWRADLSSLSPASAEAQARDAELRTDLGSGDAGVLVLAQGADADAALQAAEAAGARLDALVDDGRLAGYDSPARWLPSLALQRARQASLPDATTLQARLAEATAGGPLPASRLQPFVDDVQAARKLPLIEPQALADGALAPVLNALLIRSQSQSQSGNQSRSQSDGAGWTALLPLQGVSADASTDAAAVGVALAGLPGVQVIDIKHELDALYAGYLHEALRHAVVGALAVFALLAWHLRNLRRWWAVVQPLLLAVLMTLAGLMLFDVALGVLHLVGLLLVVAVGSNYALFFDQVQQGPRADPDTLASLLLANVTTVLSFGLIALSDIPALSAIGRVVAPGAWLALVLAAACTRQFRR